MSPAAYGPGVRRVAERPLTDAERRRFVEWPGRPSPGAIGALSHAAKFLFFVPVLSGGMVGALLNTFCRVPETPAFSVGFTLGGIFSAWLYWTDRKMTVKIEEEVAAAHTVETLEWEASRVIEVEDLESGPAFLFVISNDELVFLTDPGWFDADNDLENEEAPFRIGRSIRMEWATELEEVLDVQASGDRLRLERIGFTVRQLALDDPYVSFAVLRASDVKGRPAKEALFGADPGKGS